MASPPVGREIAAHVVPGAMSESAAGAPWCAAAASRVRAPGGLATDAADARAWPDRLGIQPFRSTLRGSSARPAEGGVGRMYLSAASAVVFVAAKRSAFDWASSTLSLVAALTAV